MSHKSNSIVSGQPYQNKYKKALLQIQKIHNANKVLKNQSEDIKAQYQQQINQLGHTLDQTQKQLSVAKSDKAQLQKFLQQLQETNSEQRKQYNNLEREISYLNEVIADQNGQLNKLKAFKDQKGLSGLIASYEEREDVLRKDVARQEELVRSLKAAYEKLQEELEEEHRQRYKFQELSNGLKLEVNRYRELNNSLVSKNETIIKGLLSKTTDGNQRFREVQTVLSDLTKQLEAVKATRAQQSQISRTTIPIDTYQTVLQQKTRAQSEITRLRQRLTSYQNASKDMFQMQQNMKKAELRAQQLHQQCNMLKSKLVVVQTKDFMQASGQDSQLKDFEERVIANIAQNDPLATIKNSSDTSHFQLMKGYVVQLKDKLAKAVIAKRQYQKKYRSLKQKLTDKAEKAIGLDEQNKLLRGKVEGYERLAQRLQFELQRSLESHQQEMNKMKAITNNILTKKTEETKVANTFIKAQLDLELDKFQKIEKDLKQQAQTLRLQLSTQKIKNGELQQQLNESEQFLNIYKKKFKQLNNDHQQTAQTNQLLQENTAKYEQLYREQKAKNEILLSQKQVLASKAGQLTEQLERQNWKQEQQRIKENSVDSQLRKHKTQVTQLRQELENTQNQLRAAQRQLQDKSNNITASFGQTNSEYYATLQRNYQQQAQNNKQLETQLQQAKLRLGKASGITQKTVALQQALASKNNQNNDLKRKLITLQKQLGLLEVQMTDVRTEYEQMRKQNQGLKGRLLQNGQQIRRNYEDRQVEGKKSNQKMVEELANANSELRQHRKNVARLQNELQISRNQKQRLDQTLAQSYKKDQASSEQIGHLRNAYENICEQTQRLKAQIKFKNDMIQKANSELAALQERLQRNSTESNDTRLQSQAVSNSYSQLKREIMGIKIYLTEIEQYSQNRAAGGTWQEQRDKENLSNFILRIKKLLRTAQTSNNIAADPAPPVRSPSGSITRLTPIPVYLRKYADPGYVSAAPSRSQPLPEDYSSSFGRQDGSYDYQ